jgi:putative Mg2+ transporter-C (MgtC) family protein
VYVQYVIELPMISEWEMILRIVLAAACGTVIGLEREWRDRAAGLRTHMLVCVGSAVFMIISAYGFAGWAEAVNITGTRGPIAMFADPARISAQVVSGIGFLGAGVIWRSRGGTHGLTTAATLWVMAAVGMAAGIGWYLLALVSTITVLFVLLVLRLLGAKVRAYSQMDTIGLQARLASGEIIQDVLDICTQEGGAIGDIKIGAPSDDGGRTLTFVVSGLKNGMAMRMIATIGAHPRVYSVETTEE